MSQVQSISAPAPTRSGAPDALQGSHPERRSDSAPGQPSGAALRQRSDPWSASAPIALRHKLCNFCTLFPPILILDFLLQASKHMLASVLA